MRKGISIALLSFSLSVILALLSGCNYSDYNKAVNLFNEENYEEAKVLFDKLGDYKDSSTYSKNCKIALRPKLYNRWSTKLTDSYGNELSRYTMGYNGSEYAALTFLDHKFQDGYERGSSIELDLAGKTYKGKLNGYLLKGVSISWYGEEPVFFADAMTQLFELKFLSDEEIEIIVTGSTILEGWPVSYEAHQYYDCNYDPNDPNDDPINAAIERYLRRQKNDG